MKRRNNKIIKSELRYKRNNHRHEENNKDVPDNRIIVSLIEPKILELVRVGENKDTLKMEVDFSTPINSSIEIRRIEKNLFQYDDIGMRCNHWSLKKIMYEFEYPKWFRGELVKLPITNEITTDEYENDTRLKEVHDNSYSNIEGQLDHLDLNKGGIFHIDLGDLQNITGMRGETFQEILQEYMNSKSKDK